MIIQKIPNLVFTRFRSVKFKQVRMKHFLTTPIFYVNAQPHIGHLYTSLLADALSRFERLRDPKQEVLFMTGTDEHGLKIHQAAKRADKSEADYVNPIAEMYKNAFKTYNVHYSHFVRTTDERHTKCVYQIWEKLQKRDLIYKGEYSGWYCTADEAFLPDSQLKINYDGSRTTLDSNRPVEQISETNYKFRLSSFREQLLEWLQRDVIRPTLFQQQVISWVEDGTALQDLSISRPRTRVPWGIPVPDDPEHTVYVWLDALCSYLTAVDGKPEEWPPDLQIIGKDILKFHSIYWPAFLMGAGLEPPKRLLCHSHWLIDGHKMSKSAGNVLQPEQQAEKFTSEGFRYFLLREAVPHNDSNYSAIKVQRILNSELADTLGNLLSRCTGKLVNSAQLFPPYNSQDHTQYCGDAAKPLQTALEALPDVVESHFSNLEIYKAVDAIVGVLHEANRLFESEKPWELRKREQSAAHLSVVLHITLETLRVCGILLSPIIPVLSDRLLNKLSIASDKRNLADARTFSWQMDEPPPAVKLSTDPLVLFHRIK